MRTMMRSTATVAVMAALAVTVGTLSTLAARAGALPADTTGSGSGTGSGVRVEITDDTRSAHSGDVIDYTVRVENDSAASYPHLEVFHLVPNGFQLVDSSPKATQEGSNVRWTADVPAGQTLVFTDQVMAGTVEESEHLTPRTRDAKPADPTGGGPGTSPAAARQFTTTACARSSASGPALACATVREQLTDGPDAASATGPAAKHWQPGLLGIGLIVALFAAFSGFFRKRRNRIDEG
ncbi:hypothetical protein GCM10009839_75690 [Catenulispora yoronensis]|uniref:DUF11 domain-containing protein n=1 Tax=Catenulispora yoronensis TaxID=450799 RepID=A0ABN2V8T6_9ACTN